MQFAFESIFFSLSLWLNDIFLESNFRFLASPVQDDAAIHTNKHFRGELCDDISNVPYSHHFLITTYLFLIIFHYFPIQAVRPSFFPFGACVCEKRGMLPTCLAWLPPARLSEAKAYEGWLLSNRLVISNAYESQMSIITPRKSHRRPPTCRITDCDNHILMSCCTWRSQAAMFRRKGP